MTNVQISPERLRLFEESDLESGSHGSEFDGEACSMEWVSYLSDEDFTDAPSCASPVLTRYIIRLNDRWSHERRQQLKPYLLRTIGTGSDGMEPIRERIAAKHLQSILPDLLRLAGMDDEIAALEAVEPGNTAQLRKTLYAVRTAAWAKRDALWAERRASIRTRIEAELQKKGLADAAAAAVAVAVAVADAVADAAADAAADAVAVADAVADAVAAAVAVADAVAVAVAAAVAAADVDFSRWSDGYWKVRDAAYAAARKVYDESPALAEIRNLASMADSRALELLDRLMDANED